MTATHGSLSNKRVGTFHILDRAPRDRPRQTRNRAHYYCRCDCGHEQLVRAQSLRRGLEGKWEARCKACGA